MSDHIENSAVGSVEQILNDTKCINVGNIAKNDRYPLYDGNIIVYKSNKSRKRKNIDYFEDLQIKGVTKKIDKRLTRQPPISHTDFLIWQYNATPQALGTVEEDWEIATYRQGYHDYNTLFTKQDYEHIKEKMTGQRKQQFFFIKPLTEEARKVILNMDFNLLAERNTSTPGFGKGDFVSYYNELTTK